MKYLQATFVFILIFQFVHYTSLSTLVWVMPIILCSLAAVFVQQFEKHYGTDWDA